jgi:drug/metabolite transporter (DMT)-like permease
MPNIYQFKKVTLQKINEFSNTISHPAKFGFLFAVLAAAFSALPNVIPKLLMSHDFAPDTSIMPNPLMLVFVIYVVNSLLFLPFRRPKKEKTSAKKVNRYTTMSLLVLLGMVETFGTLSYIVGLGKTSAINASILVNSETMFAILIGVMVFRERLDKKETLPFILIILGTILIPICSDLHNNDWQVYEFVLGDLFVMVSAMFYCLDTFIAKKLNSSIKTRHIVHVMSCTGAIMMLGLILLFEIPFDISVEQLSIISIVGFLGIGATMMFFVIALRTIGAIRTVLIYSTSIVFSMIYSTMILSESITFLNIISAGIVVFGIIILRNRINAD